MEKIGINLLRLSHTQRMENQTEQKELLTNAEQLANGNVEGATATEVKKGVLFSTQDAEEYRAFKRQKKVEEILAAISKSGGSLLNGEEIQRVCERAVRLKQQAVKVPITKLSQAKIYLKKSKVKIDCVIGGNGETLTQVKAYEMRLAMRSGAKELTVCVAPSDIRTSKYGEIRKELRQLRRLAGKRTFKIMVEDLFPTPTLSRLARIAGEIGIQYFCVPYFEGCEKLRFDMLNGCKLEICGVDETADFKKMSGVGMGRIVTGKVWDVYSEWMQEAEKIKFSPPITVTVPAPKPPVSVEEDPEKNTQQALPPSKIENISSLTSSAEQNRLNEQQQASSCCNKTTLEGSDLKFL